MLLFQIFNICSTSNMHFKYLLSGIWSIVFWHVHTIQRLSVLLSWRQRSSRMIVYCFDLTADTPCSNALAWLDRSKRKAGRGQEGPPAIHAAFAQHLSASMLQASAFRCVVRDTFFRWVAVSTTQHAPTLWALGALSLVGALCGNGVDTITPLSQAQSGFVVNDSGYTKHFLEIA